LRPIVEKGSGREALYARRLTIRSGKDIERRVATPVLVAMLNRRDDSGRGLCFLGAIGASTGTNT
jgi:hypothetical protein